jgi:hypothetical protein
MTDVVGYAAASAVLATFLMRSMGPLRLVAILSNILFLCYGYLAHIDPVLVLHAALLPINIARLTTHREGAFLSRLSGNRYLAPATARVRHISLFILGLMAGSFGTSVHPHRICFLISAGGASFDRNRNAGPPSCANRCQPNGELIHAYRSANFVSCGDCCPHHIFRCATPRLADLELGDCHAAFRGCREFRR